MKKEPTCLVCQKVMVKGFVAEFGHASYLLPRWVPGEPDPNCWTGAEAKAKQVQREGRPIVAYRCPECEALRLYAPTPEEPGTRT